MLPTRDVNVAAGGVASAFGVGFFAATDGIGLGQPALILVGLVGAGAGCMIGPWWLALLTAVACGYAGGAGIMARLSFGAPLELWIAVVPLLGSMAAVLAVIGLLVIHVLSWRPPTNATTEVARAAWAPSSSNLNPGQATEITSATAADREPHRFTRLIWGLVVLDYFVLGFSVFALLYAIPGERYVESGRALGPLGFAAAPGALALFLASFWTRQGALIAASLGLVLLAVVWAVRFVMLLHYL